MVLQGTNPIYNLLPDIFSSLSAETQLPSAQFQVSQRPCNPQSKPACSSKLMLHVSDLIPVWHIAASEQLREASRPDGR